MRINITAIVALNGGEETCICIDITSGDNTQSVKHTLLTTQFAELRIKKGEIDTHRYEEISNAASIAAAYKKGLVTLGYGAQSKRSLHYKLKAKGFTDDVSEEAISLLCRHGYINEDDSCQREAEKCINKLWGKKRIISHLYSKGFSNDMINTALLELSEIDFTENCKELILRSHKRQLFDSLDNKATLSKLVASLQRMGYSISEIKNAIKDILHDR